ncbi:hypothetical protein [Haliangium ochraceum]|uniref:Uncharacterized protein n=1 Tax=Haliangium ochraceum (strain DSM 14365 / JCM 11303 / SMP-2) TaxID=502025 RepID=D0LXR6_HALO1|nr:hypothetical protein [Haliangium ochraceum]ACY14271.1 hypothetical protein Hoch_1722 [Haliangium ochraceum DSM 14365]
MNAATPLARSIESRVRGRGGPRTQIDTRTRGALSARSVVRLSGDICTWVAADAPAEAARQHRRAVAQAARSRSLWIDLAATALAGSARLATAGLGPASALSAWRLARRALDDIAALQRERARARGHRRGGHGIASASRRGDDAAQ